MERLIDGERRLRREYSADFKALVLRQTRERGASVSGVALSHGLHPNMVHRWLREQRLLREKVPPSTPAFVPLPVQSVVSQERVALSVTPPPAPVSGICEAIHIEVQRHGTTVTMDWPVTAAAQCAQMLRELLQ
ncbi:transposase [Aquabacterium sp.]|uniref:IS66-like element accessory protein TnpA n=1 Tax=Aquabacterium sp. TaxID=1872578 RepID=UPI0035AF4B99